MIALTDFINKWNGKYVESNDPTNLYQCYDLALQFTIELGIPKGIFPYLNAYQIYTNFGTEQAKYFDRIYNSPNAVAKEGDLIVWGNSYNYAGGHVGMCKSADVWNLNCFVQNDPMRTPAHMKTYNYNFILGWLRPKAYSTPLTCDQKLAQIKTWANNTSIPDSDFRYKVKNM